MQLKSHFVAKNQKYQDVYRLFKWKKVDCEIRSAKGDVHFALKGVRAPEPWSSLAVEIAAAKYFRKKGVPESGSEKSIQQMIDRVVSSVKKSGLKQGYFKHKSEADVFANELCFILLSQRAFFNSPVWFNCGLYESYGIRGESKTWAWNNRIKKVEELAHSYVRPQVSACFIQKVEDSLESIFELAKNEAKLFKFGSGSGTNFSNLRSKYENLEGGGTSSGLISFLEVLDRGAGSIKSGGTTRRAAKMVCLDVDHPEIVEFIQWKAREEKKAQALVAAGFDGSFEGEAYRTVAGQNANNSVRITDAFMKALGDRKSWTLRSRTTGKKIMEMPAEKIWNEIGLAAHSCADPGLQFVDAIDRWHTCPDSGEIRASNPCSEYMFLDDSACNLASINLLQFLDVDGGFDIESYIHTIQVMTLAQDILVDLAGYPTSLIAENSHRFRPLGLGYCGLGAFLMRKAVPYDSVEGRSWAALLTSLLSGQAYLTSARLAAELGPFAEYSKNKKSVLKVLKQHHSAQKKIASVALPTSSVGLADSIWKSAIELAAKKGVRNSQVSVMAPTGTIGLVMDCDTTGVEPEYSLIKYKKLSGGGDLVMVNQSVEPALFKLGYSDQQQQEILDYLRVHGSLEGAPNLNPEHYAVFDCAQPGGNLGMRFLSGESHLLMMAAIQPFLSGAISKTVNLPADCTPEEILAIYRRAWQLRLKSIAIYRDGSKGSQPLSSPKRWKGDPSWAPVCPDCGAPTELAGGCFRCINCGTNLGCA